MRSTSNSIPAHQAPGIYGVTNTIPGTIICCKSYSYIPRKPRLTPLTDLLYTKTNTIKTRLRAHLIGLKKICFQKIKNRSWALIGRSVSTPRMVILIFRKFCFQPRSPGGLFRRNSGYLFYSKLMRCAPPSVPNIQSQHWYLHLSRDTREHTGKHAQ